MDKTFEDIISEVVGEEAPENNSDPEEEFEESEETETEELENESEETNDDESEETDDEMEDSSEDDTDPQEDVFEDLEEDSDPSSTNDKDARAFAEMRTKNKELKQYYDFFDAAAKNLGLKDINELIAKTNEANIKKQAKEQGIPFEIAKKLNDLEIKVARQEVEQAAREQQAKNDRLSATFNNFVQANKLSEEQVKKLAKDLIADGMNLDYFKNMPDRFINRALSSYVAKDLSKQKLLEKKEKIQKEIPSGSKSNGSEVSKVDEIDKIAKMLLERP